MLFSQLWSTLKNRLKAPRCADCPADLNSEEDKFCLNCRTVLGQRPAQPLLINDALTLYAASDLTPAFKQQLYGYKYYQRQNANWLSDFYIDYWYALAKEIDPKTTRLLLIPPHANAMDSERLLHVAQPFAEAFGYSLETSTLKWRRSCFPQHTLLNRRERFRNVAGAFVVDATTTWENVQRVIILDDVMTTGATLMSAARAIREVGDDKNLQIDGLALCRIPFQPQWQTSKESNSQKSIWIQKELLSS